MKTKLLMTSSSIYLGIIGLVFSFLPKETLLYLNIESSQTTGLMMQIMGSLYLGFGIMNWMGKGSIIGGIYNKPMVIGNFMHFGVGAITLLKIVFGVQANKEIIIALTIMYSIFAISFALVFMRNPSKVKS